MPLSRLCAARGCGAYRESGRFCRSHAREDDQRRGAKWRASKGGTAAWRRLRERALRRDNYRCLRCGHGEHLSVHIDPRLGGDHSRARLQDCQTLCRRCHGSVDAARAHA